jgi:two-component system, NarL family, sensor histidine kinase UhpB
MHDMDAYVSWKAPLGSSMEQRAIADACEAERRGLAHELHDTVIQPLTSLVMSFTCFEQGPPSEDSTNSHLNQWRELAEEALDSLRSTLAGFRPFVHGGSGGLPEALQRCLAPQLGSRGMQLNVESRNWPQDLPSDWNWHLYLAVREALTNVEKHATASEVNAHLHAEADFLVITVADNGVGLRCDEFATGWFAQPGCGLGMSGIRERLSMLGGHLDIAAEPGHGVRLEMWLPRPPNAETTATADMHGCTDADWTANQYIH